MAKRDKKILIIAERFNPEEFGINDLAKAWVKEYKEVAVITQVPSYPFDKVFKGYENRIIQKELWNEITIHRVYSVLGYTRNKYIKVLSYFSFAFFASMAAIVFGRKYDYVYIYQVGPLTQAIPGIILKYLFNKKLFIWTLDIWPESVFAYGFKKSLILRKSLDLFVRIVYRSCDSIFVSCKGFEYKIKRYAPNAKIYFTPQWVPDGLNFNGASPSMEMKEGFNFTFAGNVGKVQNLENVILGFSKLSQNGQKSYLNIIGDGSNLSSLKALVESNGIKNVIFWGRRPMEEMPKWFLASDVLIVSLIDKPIFSLTIPAKFQAYLAANRPILSVMNGELTNMVEDSQIGYGVNPSDLDMIKGGFERFINTPHDTIECFKRNMVSLLPDYTKDSIVDRKTSLIN